MPRGSKDKYSEKQKRKAEHIEDSYEEKGVPKEEAEKRAWATVNKQSGGGERAGSGKNKSNNDKSRARKDSAKRAVATKKGVSRKDSLELETKASLMEKARSRNIRGRSTMRKDQLIAALKKAS